MTRHDQPPDRNKPMSAVTDREPVRKDVSVSENCPNLPGVFDILGKLGPCTWITVPGLAEILGKDRTTVTRAVDKGQLPIPVKLLSDSGWTLRVLIAHIEQRLVDAASEADTERERQREEEKETAEAERKLLSLSP